MAFSNFIPEVWSARLLEHLDKVHVYAALMNRDYEGDIRAYGDTVHINQIGSITINDYTGDDIEAPEELDSTMTVSYTHLDVYKRQGRRFRDIRSCWPTASPGRGRGGRSFSMRSASTS